MAIVVDDCCGFIELKNGCFIIGYTNLAYTIYLIFQSIVNIVKGDALMRQNSTTPYNTPGQLGSALVVMYSVILLIGLLELIFTILLLVGLHKNKRGCVMAHLIFNVVFLVVYILGFISYLESTHFTFSLNMISDISIIFSTIYYLLVIRSYYVKMGGKVKPATECNSS